MLTIEDCLKILEKKYPERCFSGAEEYEKCYMFGSFERTWNGDSDDLKVGRGMDVVDKQTGSLDRFGFVDDDSKYGQFIGIVDIIPYLSQEDKNLLEKVRSKE